MPNPTTIALVLLTLLALAASFLAFAALRRGDARPGLVKAQHSLTGVCIVGAALLFLYRAWFENKGWQPLGAHVDGLLLIAPLFAAAAMFVQRAGMRGLSVFALPLLTLLLAWAICASVWTYAPFAPDTMWLAIHKATVYGGTIFFCIAAAAGALYLYAQRRLRQHRNTLETSTGGGLASLEATEQMIVRTATIGFALITVGLITGLVIFTDAEHASLGVGWWYAPKMVLATAAWLAYAVLMNIRFATAFRGKRAAWLSIVGLALLIATFGAVSAMEARP